MLKMNVEKILGWLVADEPDATTSFSSFAENFRFGREMLRDGHERDFFVSCLVADSVSEVFSHAVESLPAVTAFDESDNDYCDSYGMYFHTVDFHLVVRTPAQKAELAKVSRELDELHEEYMCLAHVVEDEFQGEYGDWSEGSFTLAFRDLYDSGGGNADWVHLDDHLRMYRLLRRFSELCIQVTSAVEVDVAA